MAIAVSLGRPIVRWWVGTDVYQVLEKTTIAENVRSFRWLFSMQIAVSPHLVQELETAGVHAQYIPSITELDKAPTVLNSVPKSILVYLPTQRKGFYGVSFLESAIKTYRDIEFVIVADETHSLVEYPNVRSVGWVGEMSEIWNSVGCLLRITRHDGMPRMVLEALLRGKYVIYSWPFPGCMLARSEDQMLRAIKDFRKFTSVNWNGISKVQELLTPDPGARFSAVLTDTLNERNLARRIRGMWVALALTCKMKYRLRRERSL